VTSAPYDALLFDFDGVLADTEKIHHASWNTVLEPYGIHFTWPEYLKQCVGIADPIVAQSLQLPDPALAVARKQQLLRQGLEQTPPFSKETLDLLHELSTSYRMAVVSSSFQTEIYPPIERAGLLPLFETLVFGNEVQNLKPAPDPYLLAVQRLSVRNPLVIEDSDAGVASGKAAGLEVLRVAGPDTMPNQLRQLLGISMIESSATKVSTRTSSLKIK
jgi:HAD superfamily hydrolase (TIGR01509 family)